MTMKIITYSMLLAAAFTAVGCSNDDTVAESTGNGRESIELGDASSIASRAGFTKAKTTLKLHYVSSIKPYNESTFPYNDVEDKAAPLYMTSSATAAVDATKSETSVSKVTQTTGADGEKRYWDDIHGRNSILSLYAIAVPNKETVTKNATAFNAWDTKQKEGTGTAVVNTIDWTVSTEQTLKTIADEDLTYSNNVTGDNTIGFDTSTKKFEKAEGTKSLVFNHALSRITINIKKGDGFGDFASDFKVTSVKLSGFNTTGTLNVESGAVTTTTSSNDVETVGSKTVYPATGIQLGYTYVAQVLPNTTLKDVTTTMLTVTVDGNVFPITGNDIYNSLSSHGVEADISSLKPGKNYNLTLLLNKTSIEITDAKLVDWDTINGTEVTPSNAIALTTTMEQSAGDASKVVASDLYRSTTLATGYVGNKTTLAADGKTMGTTWYWPDNNTTYFFRTISPQGTTVTSATNDYITMTGGAIADGNDFIWGAPLEEKHTDASHSFTYNNGYGDYLYPAIGATKSDIHLTQFHMMSNIEVNLKTSTGDDAVDLSDATVEILNYDNSATLALSNAAITLSGSKTGTSGAITTADHLKHTWRVIPQTTTGITLKITASGNVYKVALPADTGIASWLPGKSYVYTFKLLKTAIHITSAKLVDWETVTAADKTVTIE